jgi:hypothetical protein
MRRSASRSLLAPRPPAVSFARRRSQPAWGSVSGALSYDILLCWNNEGGFLDRGPKPVSAPWML